MIISNDNFQSWLILVSSGTFSLYRLMLKIAKNKSVVIVPRNRFIPNDQFFAIPRNGFTLTMN